MQFTSKHYHAWTTMCKMILLSYPPVDDRPSLWDKALNAACVSHITWQLYHRSCDYYCFPVFQGRPYHFAPLMSFWRHDFSPDTNSATDRRSIFRNLFVHSLLNQSYMASLSSFCSFFLLEQTKFLDAELKYLNTFLNWCKIIFDKLKKKIHDLINTISMREKYSASLRGFYMMLIHMYPSGGMVVYVSLWKSLIII